MRIPLKLTLRSTPALVVVLGGVFAAAAALSGQADASNRPAASYPTPRPAALAPAAEATNVYCGETLNASVTLNGDLHCPNGTALTILKNSIVLNLGGHVVSGTGIGSLIEGIIVYGNTDTVENGAVTGFRFGVEVAGADTVTNIHASSDGYGIYERGGPAKFTNNILTHNYYGVVSDSTGSTYTGNKALNNSYDGIDVYGTKTVLTSNVASGNALIGINDTGTATTLTKNVANYNTNDGMAAYADLLVVDGGGNTAKGNDYGTGDKPIQCNGVACG